MARGRRAGRERPQGPQRRCVGCRLAKPQAVLLRLAVRGGQVVADPGRSAPGRGCWLCRNAGCAAAAAKGRQIARALRGKAPEPPAARVLEWLDLKAADQVQQAGSGAAGGVGSGIGRGPVA